MKTAFATILAALVLAGSGALASPTPFPRQPGYGPNPPHNPTGLFGLIRDPIKYHTLCDVHSHHPSHDHRPRACFDTELVLKEHLSAPNPETLHGYIDGSNTNMVLYTGQIITLSEKLEIHVNNPKKDHEKAKGCSEVLIYQLPKWKLQMKETWCPYKNKPIEL
ncbi:hypothetical protein NDA16_002337 [Ustilago loliicola]|nr:hypothetical protein NDA16_002337 [Ustilago loliicola]